MAEGVDAGQVLLNYHQDPAEESRLANRRVVVLLEAGARLALVEDFNRQGDIGQALNLVYQVSLGTEAALEHTRLQRDSSEQVLIDTTHVTLEAGAHMSQVAAELGGGLVRHDLQAVLAGEGAGIEVSGAYVLTGSRLVDNHLLVDHAAPGCRSEQYFRGVLADSSRGVFNGKALIREGADESVVHQSNGNLLLSRQAEIDTKPELEIYADEVEASHGATVGQLDENAVFYLQSRGISEARARQMLTAAFCRSVTDRIGNTALAERMAALVDQSMPGASQEESRS